MFYLYYKFCHLFTLLFESDEISLFYLNLYVLRLLLHLFSFSLFSYCVLGLTSNIGFQVIQRKLVQVVTPSTATDGNIGPDAVHLLAIKEVCLLLVSHVHICTNRMSILVCVLNSDFPVYMKGNACHLSFNAHSWNRIRCELIVWSYQ